MARAKGSRVAGSARRYIDPNDSSKTISRRKYDQLKQAAGERTKRDESGATRARIASRRYAALAKDYAEQHGVSVRQARNSPELKKAIREIKSPDWKTVVKALKELGRREGIPDYVKPGESPEWKRSGAEKLPRKEQRAHFREYLKHNR